MTPVTNGSLHELRTALQQAGISHGVVCNIAVKAGQTQNVHQFACDIQKQNGLSPRLIAFSSVHPKEDNWKEWLKTVKDDGFLGIKLHPDYQGFYINDPSMESFYQEAFRLGLTILFHAGEDDGKPEPCHASVKRIADILPVLQQGNVILAHMGGNKQSKEVISLLCGKGIYMDTSYCLSEMDLEDAKKIISKNEPDFILFGSDVPWKTPKAVLDCLKNQVASDFLSKENLAKILWRNGATLLNL